MLECYKKNAKNHVGKIILYAPISGEIVAVADIPDEVFALGILGDGIGIIPTKDEVVAPCDGKITAIIDSGHAVVITAPNGMEILLHVGLNTVELRGKFFEYAIKEGDTVKRGDLLIKFDLDQIKAAGYQMHTPLLVTNADDYGTITTLAEGKVRAGDKILSIE